MVGFCRLAASRVRKGERYADLISMTGARIKAARESMGVSQPELVRLAKLDKSLAWLSDIERGANSIDPHDLRALATATGYPLEWFLDPGFERRRVRAPLTRIEWTQLYDDRERAEAHWQLDEIFRRVIERGEEIAAHTG